MQKDRIFVVGAMVAVLVAYTLLFGPGGRPKDLAGKQPPPINQGGTWLNSDQPLSWDILQGKVVWLEFSFLH